MVIDAIFVFSLSKHGVYRITLASVWAFALILRLARAFLYHFLRTADLRL
jgi:hypothetical protein|tara:strand:- start:1115 stop:1264 length:150 start_codon:yes stop_codon:yes gene_type:complete